jgi:hypothetical protein
MNALAQTSFLPEKLDHNLLLELVALILKNVINGFYLLK